MVDEIQYDNGDQKLGGAIRSRSSKLFPPEHKKTISGTTQKAVNVPEEARPVIDKILYHRELRNALNESIANIDFIRADTNVTNGNENRFSIIELNVNGYQGETRPLRFFVEQAENVARERTAQLAEDPNRLRTVRAELFSELQACNPPDSTIAVLNDSARKALRSWEFNNAALKAQLQLKYAQKTQEGLETIFKSDSGNQFLESSKREVKKLEESIREAFPDQILEGKQPIPEGNNNPKAPKKIPDTVLAQARHAVSPDPSFVSSHQHVGGGAEVFKNVRSIS